MSASIGSIPLRRRTTAAVGLAALALTLGACGEQGTGTEVVGSATSAAGSVTGGAQPTAEGGGAGDPEEEFLGDIRRVGVDVTDRQDYLTRGRDACGALDGGTGYIDVLRQYGDAHPEAPTTEAPAVVVAAVKALCSQHAPQLGQGERGQPDGGG